MIEENALCECGGVLVANGQNWVHLGGGHRCPPGRSSEDGFAFPVTEDDIEARIDAAEAEGYERCLEENDEQVQDRIDYAQREAREEALADVIRAVERL